MTKVLRTIPQLRAQVTLWRQKGLVVGFVPTMGYLHEGHMSLVRQAKDACDRVIVSIFVNPTQFDAESDFTKYPRDEARDLAMLQEVDAAFVPTSTELYPTGCTFSVKTPEISEHLEGAHRPGHFDGMATIVLKLINIVQADTAYFGEKDWQQLLLIKRMAIDFNLTTRIVGCPTIREADGLAKSSRNARLDKEARALAPKLYDVIRDAALLYKERQDRARATQFALAEFARAGITNVDYLRICDETTLLPASSPLAARVFVAASINGIRLIDNVAVSEVA